MFWDTFKTLVDLHFPLTKTKFNKKFHKKQGFMTKGLLISRLAKIKLHQNSVALRTPESIATYKKYRNLYNTILRASKKLYFFSEIQKSRKNPKKTWQILNEAMQTNTQRNTIEKITSNGNLLTSPLDIANSFNEFFAGIGNKIANDIPLSNVDPKSYLQPCTAPPLEFNKVCQGEVSAVIKCILSKTSTDVDGLTSKLLKFVANEISIPLSHIFSLSLDQGKFPNKLKTSRIVPIFKGGRKDLCDNYRPIACLSAISKILEKIVATKLVNHLTTHKLISKNQFGFQRFISTEHNLVSLINYVSSALNDSKYCVGIFLDLKKAFDVCDHGVLFAKLESLGIIGTALNWFKSYLSDRQQRVDINGQLSNTKEIDLSVIQGSILGPILFLCYINDLPNASNLFTLMFADDTQGLACGNDLDQLIDFVNLELKKWATWFSANRMAVNVSKTKFIIFHNKGKKVNMNGKQIVFDTNIGTNSNPSLISPLERIHSNHPDPDHRHYKLLGVLIDENLTFQSHINYVRNKLSKSIFIINRVTNILPQKSLKDLYFALVHSHLTYCPIIVGCSSKSNIDKIFIMQKKAIRVITNSDYRAHTDQLFKKLQILPFAKIIEQAKLLFMHSVYYNYAPKSFQTPGLLTKLVIFK